MGRNLDTGAIGMCPLDCLRLSDHIPTESRGIAGMGTGSIRYASLTSQVASGVFQARRAAMVRSIFARCSAEGADLSADANVFG